METGVLTDLDGVQAQSMAVKKVQILDCGRQ